MQQNYQDAMSIVTKFGKPDLFLTFTCNPKCEDILQALPEGQRPEDRPDIVARVYKLHLKELLHDIKTEHVLGVPVAHVRVIEFQKRGLPHAHILIILSEECKLRNGDHIDTIISAEIPDQLSDPQLYEIVKSTMVHGPCGILNPHCVCMEDGVCSKDYPKEFQERTIMNTDGYPLYRRRDNGRTMQVGTSRQIDNRWIVPYNPYLTRKYKAHINVEACTTVKSVKYLFKYVYKGHDCANIEIRSEGYVDIDEVSTFLDARYVSAPEAFWRLSEYALHEQSHTIVRLAVHLPEQQLVYFREGQHQEALASADSRDTMLTAYFRFNSESPTEYTYPQFPNHYVFNKKWKPRQRGGDSVIGRMYFVSPKQTERYCLRLLLLHVTGATSYEYLRTVNGVVMNSFKEACIALHLLPDDAEWDKTLHEASNFQMPKQLRSLFATICCHCEPTGPLSLWISHKQAMTEDFIHQGISSADAERMALFEISVILEECGLTCEGIGLPNDYIQQPVDAAVCGNENDSITDHVIEGLLKLNDDQYSMADAAIRALNRLRAGDVYTSKCFFCDGPGGSGKTFIYNTLMSYCNSTNFKYAASAWTGIAATLLTGGRTIHSLFKLPVPIVETSTCNVTPTSSHADYLRSVDIYILDEASMIPSDALRAIDIMLRDITGVDVAFGGKVFLLGGDFRQVLPVIPRGNRTKIVENCLKASPLWTEFQVFTLKKNMRAKPEELEFADWLLRLGNGTLPNEQINDEVVEDLIAVPDQCQIVDHSIVDSVFTDLENNALTYNSTILSPKNEDTLRINNLVISKLPGEPITYLSADRAIIEEGVSNYSDEFLHGLTPSGMPPHRLDLKVNTVIMLMRNICVRQGLCNGTRLTIKHLHQHVIDAEILTGSNAGHRTLIPRIKLAPSDVSLPFVLERRQFPIRAAYSMTINKAQGQSFDKVGIFLPSPVFTHGQLYVAFSRAKAFSDVCVQVLPHANQGRKGKLTLTKNVVFKEIL